MEVDAGPLSGGRIQWGNVVTQRLAAPANMSHRPPRVLMAPDHLPPRLPPSLPPRHCVHCSTSGQTGPFAFGMATRLAAIDETASRPQPLDMILLVPSPYRAPVVHAIRPRSRITTMVHGMHPCVRPTASTSPCRYIPITDRRPFAVYTAWFDDHHILTGKSALPSGVLVVIQHRPVSLRYGARRRDHDFDTTRPFTQGPGPPAWCWTWMLGGFTYSARPIAFRNAGRPTTSHRYAFMWRYPESVGRPLSPSAILVSSAFRHLQSCSTYTFHTYTFGTHQIASPGQIQ